jgi:hypothetical protein
MQYMTVVERYIPSCFISTTLSVLRGITTANNADEMVTCSAGSMVFSVCYIFTHISIPKKIYI